MRDMATGWLAAVALPCSFEQRPCPALHVHDIELPHILVAGRLSCRMGLERRHMLVSPKLICVLSG